MVLVTGGSGLVGSHLITALLMQGSSPKVLIRSEASKNQIRKVIGYYTKNSDELFNKIQWVHGDILDKASVFEAMDEVQFVYHCAAVVSFDKRDRKQMLETNIRGTANIVNVCIEQKISKLLYVSSVAAIKDNTGNALVTEDNGWPTTGTLNYSYSKTQAEFEVWRGITEGLNAVIINPSIILGPGNWNSGSSKFFPTVYGGLKFYTRGVTGFVDVQDVVKLMILLMNSEIQNQRFIISSENLSYQQVLNAIATAFGVKVPTVYASPLMTRIGCLFDAIKSALFFSRPLITKQTSKSAHSIQYYSSEKVKTETGFSFTPVEDSIIRIAGQFINDFKSRNH